MKNIFLLILSLLSFSSCKKTSLGGDLQLPEGYTIDFGNIENGEYRDKLSLVNLGEEPIEILNARSSCGCLIPAWTNELIAPGDTAYLGGLLNTRKRKGIIRKTISYKTSAGIINLVFKGKIMDRSNQESLSDIKANSLFKQELVREAEFMISRFQSEHWPQDSYYKGIEDLQWKGFKGPEPPSGFQDVVYLTLDARAALRYLIYQNTDHRDEYVFDRSGNTRYLKRYGMNGGNLEIYFDDLVSPIKRQVEMIESDRGVLNAPIFKSRVQALRGLGLEY